MKKLIAAFATLKFIFLVLLALPSFSGCQSVSYSQQTQTAPVATPIATPQKPDDSVNRPTSDPYRGDLSIFEDPKREENLQINRVMDILKISEGKTAADIGAGSGWFTVRAARRVGGQGAVYAVEINQEYINYINERAKRENLPNIKTILGEEENPLLPENEIDAVLILKTYHEIAQPVRFLRNLRPSLKKNGLVGVIDRNGKGDDHGVGKETVIQEAKKAGFNLVEEHDFVKPDGMDYFLVFRVR